MTSTIHTLTKTLLMAATLSLVAACDAEPEAADIGPGDVSLRPLSGIQLNTSFIGGFEFSELDTNFGVAHNDSVLLGVSVIYKRDPIPLDAVWVEKGMIVGRKGTMVFKGHDFLNSRWSLKLDYDHDGSMDSSIETTILSVVDDWTGVGDPYIRYNFAYDWKTAGGVIKKYIEPSEKPTPTCEVDVDTGSLEAVAIGDLSVDRKSGDMSIRKNTIQIACFSSATGKTATWNYLYHLYDVKTFETMVRMIRADYCGDGYSWTEPGQKLQLEDVYGVNGFVDPSGKDEAFWVVGGAAACLNLPRHPGVNVADVVAYCGIPECKGDEPTGYYGDSFHTKNMP
ncbi:MAG: ADYC domain-containing protein [Nannocystaceae bacterium]